jgi:hypothetical protein
MNITVQSQCSGLQRTRSKKSRKGDEGLESATRGLSGEHVTKCMVISVTQSSKIEFADWLGVIGTTRRRGTCFSQK